MTPRRGLTIAEIVNTAAAIADREGLKELSIGAVAKDLNIKPPSLYNHVRGLDELHDLLALNGCQTLYENLQQATEGYSKDEAVRRLSHAYIDFAKTHPGLYEAGSRSAADENVTLKEAQYKVVEVVLGVFYAYGIQEDHSIHLVRMFRSMLHGFVTLDASQGFGLPHDLRETQEIMIETFLQGIKGR
ncbi:TetR/AcrR family transcriptional regulator [Alkalicoccobacillus murimartini]|uniref:AcrR family transcriptional regulator n=1 Tax=Alkalicoccobacillus murimartini TaxID=171685 RepID=A0ABT9YII8_9BACI|nr:TetR-like C-terminal domain-containing protein [Alkalicoccobacillus murimartini]MDQ0207666.1 AcrR family transcriptional regulator [Alkalicoccobacillus murimartini]